MLGFMKNSMVYLNAKTVFRPERGRERGRNFKQDQQSSKFINVTFHENQHDIPVPECEKHFGFLGGSGGGR